LANDNAELANNDHPPPTTANDNVKTQPTNNSTTPQLRNAATPQRTTHNATTVVERPTTNAVCSCTYVSLFVVKDVRDGSEWNCGEALQQIVIAWLWQERKCRVVCAVVVAGAAIARV